MHTLAGCERIVVVGRTGSGKTTLACELAAALGVPHVELDSRYFGPQFSTAPLALLRERTSAAIAGDRWVTDGNRQAVRDLVWPRADPDCRPAANPGRAVSSADRIGRGKDRGAPGGIRARVSNLPGSDRGPR